ncbi:unnamed protein product [Lymnaea stagnalis]|uniref:Uncharacterized protein n=1 Tax=Lymnaea stagnalis TaxID=6523 RepID=A0AAV2HWK0_LYMST
MASERQGDNRFLRILKKQLETLREESNHLEEVVDSYFKQMENKVQEWENKPRNSQVTFKKLSITIQQAITHVMSKAIHFTGVDDEATSDATFVTTQRETTINEPNICRDEAGSQEQCGADSVKMKISMLEDVFVSMDRRIQDMHLKQDNVDVKFKHFLTQHEALNRKLDMVEENSLNYKKGLQHNIKEQSDKFMAMSTSLQNKITDSQIKSLLFQHLFKITSRNTQINSLLFHLLFNNWRKTAMPELKKLNMKKKPTLSQQKSRVQNIVRSHHV